MGLGILGGRALPLQFVERESSGAVHPGRQGIRPCKFAREGEVVLCILGGKGSVFEILLREGGGAVHPGRQGLRLANIVERGEWCCASCWEQGLPLHIVRKGGWMKRLWLCIVLGGKGSALAYCKEGENGAGIGGQGLRLAILLRGESVLCILEARAPPLRYLLIGGGGAVHPGRQGLCHAIFGRGGAVHPGRQGICLAILQGEGRVVLCILGARASPLQI
ncbi:hypothetical protein LSTR_LSTR002884 [Laodelphax striatellus]|uniref:Uncharacterized protein n=1 Tax=Laodelphax striatellus TaxID=195883 RepID=A0A482XTB7_LAOST|nr:hypothetical protein LSTR_LSTR002884 [Laodelphax striatellus]